MEFSNNEKRMISILKDFILPKYKHSETIVEALVKIYKEGSIKREDIYKILSKKNNKISSSAYRWYNELKKKNIIKEENGWCSLNETYKKIFNTIFEVYPPFDVLSYIPKPEVRDYFGVSPINLSKLLIYLTAAGIPSNIAAQALEEAIKKVKELNVEQITEEELLSVLCQALRKYSDVEKYAESFYESYNFKIRTSLYEDGEKFSVGLIVENYADILGKEITRSLTKEACDIIRKSGFKEVSSLFYRCLLQNILLNQRKIELIKNIMYHGISEEEFERKYADPYHDLALSARLRSEYVTNTLLNQEEIKAMKNGDIFIHFLELFGSRVILFSIDCLQIAEKGLEGHSPPKTLEGALSQFKQIHFSYPYIASDIVFDTLNYVLASFPFKQEEQTYLTQYIQGFLCEIDHAMKIMQDPSMNFKRMAASINLSTLPLTSELNLKGLGQRINLADEKVKNRARYILKEFLNQLVKGDYGNPYLYPLVYVKLHQNDEIQELLSLVARVFLRWKEHSLYVTNIESWKPKYNNIVYGDYMDCIRASSSEDPVNSLGTGICGIVSLNVPRIAREHLQTGRPIEEILHSKLKIIIPLLDRHKKRLSEIYKELLEHKKLPCNFNFSYATSGIGIIGMKEYIEFLNEDPSSKGGVEKAKKLLETILKISKELTQERIALIQTFMPQKDFAVLDSRKYGKPVVKNYTQGCTLVSDKIFPIENSKEIISAIQLEKPLYELMEGGGPAFDLKIAGNVTEENLTNLIQEMLKNQVPVFSFKVLSK